MYWCQYLVISTIILLTYSQLPPYKSYSCINGLCKELSGTEKGVGLEICQMTCGIRYGSLWPMPTGNTKIGANTVEIGLNAITVTSDLPTGVNGLVSSAWAFFQSTLNVSYGKKVKNSSGRLNVYIAVEKSDTVLTLDTNESYTLDVTAETNGCSAKISATTFYGARHGLETLSQLIGFDDISQTLRVVGQATISDSPVFPYRGVSLDTSRNFFSVESIKAVLDAMSYNKMNILHWHFTDSQSFSYESRVQPLMTYYGAYSPDMVYLQSDVVDLISYANVRGIKIIPEIDAPAHAGNGWQWGPSAGKGELALCVNEQPWTDYCLEPPCGQLNPLNPNTYQILGSLYNELLDLFYTTDMFHMGGDEVSINCWNSSEVILRWLNDTQKNRTKPEFMNLWGSFQQQAFNILKSASSRPVRALLWSSDLTNTDEYALKYLLPKENYIIGVWDYSDTEAVPNLLKNGYNITVSNADAWYLDCGFSNWVTLGDSWCGPYKGWQLVYENSPYLSLKGKWNVTDPNLKKLILGGSAAIWSEEIDSYSIQMKLWPRGSAVAERLWSNPKTGWFEAVDRMVSNRERLVKRGIGADALMPRWCVQNEGQCAIEQSPMPIEQK